MADMMDVRYNVPQDQEAMQRIRDSFPEREVFEGFITDDKDPNIHLVADAEVFVTFISEGAGYKNSFGYFTFELDEAGKPDLNSISEHISIFDNASALHSGGDLLEGDTVKLGLFPAGTHIGFYLIANGFNGGNTTYYSIAPEKNPDGLRHTVGVFDIDSCRTFFGFEDLYNGGDKDYNDLLFTCQSTPWTAISRTNFARTDDIYFPEKLFSRCSCQYKL